MHGNPSMHGPDSLRTAHQRVDAGFRVITPHDALDSLDIVRPSDFQVGVLVVFLDDEQRPMAGIAIDGAPSNELCAVGESIVRCLADPHANSVVHAVVFGIVRNRPRTFDAATDEVQPGRGSGLYVDSDELSSWQECQLLLANQGIDPLFLLVLEPDGWASFPER